MKVKVCGITNLSDALLCQSAGADALGFIFYPGSKRYVPPEVASLIIRKLSPFIIKVGVFVDEPAEFVNRIASYLKLNLVQLHGSETPRTADEIDFPVIKSFKINDSFNFSLLDDYKNVYHLLDSFSEVQHGGTGNKFNWEIIPGGIKHKIILAGGISSENIEAIYKDIGPAAIDLSSSLEKEPGKKDNEKVTDFFRKVSTLCSSS